MKIQYRYSYEDLNMDIHMKILFTQNDGTNSNERERKGNREGKKG